MSFPILLFATYQCSYTESTFLVFSSSLTRFIFMHLFLTNNTQMANCIFKIWMLQLTSCSLHEWQTFVFLNTYTSPPETHLHLFQQSLALSSIWSITHSDSALAGPSLTQTQLHLVHHSLGLSSYWSISYSDSAPSGPSLIQTQLHLVHYSFRLSSKKSEFALPVCPWMFPSSFGPCWCPQTLFLYSLPCS